MRKSMRIFASLPGLVLLASLGGCASTSGLTQIGLLSGDQDESTAEAAAPATLTSAEAPPLPERNGRRGRGKSAPQLAGRASEQEAKQTAGLTLPNLTDVKLFTAVSHTPDQSQWEQAPIAVYTQLAQQIRACWFTPGAPKLKNHGFHAEVSPDNADAAKIIIYEKDPEGKRGVQAFRINITGRSGGSTVQGENRRLDKSLDSAFKSDLVRWSKGDQTCKI